MINNYFQDDDDIPIKRNIQNSSFNELLLRRMSRRALLKTSGLASANVILSNSVFASKKHQSSLTFEEISRGLDAHLHIANNYSLQVLLRWGDSLFKETANFDPYKQSEKEQLTRFGYNNDFVTYLSISKEKELSNHGLLVVNHEYVTTALMHPGSPKSSELTRQQIDTEIAAHGLSIVEVHKKNKVWKLNYKSLYNRRITPLTKMKFSGPAKGDQRVKTKFSSQGEECLGTFGNCAGCITPWGTVLTAEENIQFYFMGNAKNTAEYESYKRFGLYGGKTALSLWGKYHENWNLDKHPQAAMHAGWIVEFDPYDPTSIPIKRTALGRCKHEGCDVHINKDGRVVLYMGDDQAFEYIYRFVSKNKYQAGNQKRICLY